MKDMQPSDHDKILQDVSKHRARVSIAQRTIRDATEELESAAHSYGLACERLNAFARAAAEARQKVDA